MRRKIDALLPAPCKKTELLVVSHCSFITHYARSAHAGRGANPDSTAQELICKDHSCATEADTSMLDPNRKKRVIEKFKTHATDTGSPQVQIALLSEEIKELTDHLRTHKKDFSSRRGLIKKVSERRRLMKYLKREDSKSYDELMTKLKI